MPEKIINGIIIFTLCVVTFTLVSFGFDWIYQLWLVEEYAGWVVPFIAIPAVGVPSALLIYLFCFAISEDKTETGMSNPR